MPYFVHQPTESRNLEGRHGSQEKKGQVYSKSSILANHWRVFLWGHTTTSVSGLPGPKKFKRPSLAISCFKKVQILTNKKVQQIFEESLLKWLKQFWDFHFILSVFPKQASKGTIFLNIKKNGQIISSGKRFQKRPNGNPDKCIGNWSDIVFSCPVFLLSQSLLVSFLHYILFSSYRHQRLFFINPMDLLTFFLPEKKIKKIT
jgi:hypothetical protein